MKTYINYQLATIILLISVFVGSSQNALIPKNLPSADAAALGKYGQFPVSHYNGQANISIPVFNLESNDINLDYSLNYDGGGILVDQHPGWVGQNWTLTGGGLITRSVNGIADEEGNFGGQGYYNDNVSYIYTVLNLQNWFNENNTNDSIKLKQFAHDRILAYLAPVDTEPDIFTFNFNGKRGKFYLDQNGTWKIISDDNIKVEFDITEVTNYQDPFILNPPLSYGNIRYDKVIRGFKLIDENGYKYTFGYDTAAIEYALPFFKQYSSWSYFGNPNWIANTWHMTKIEDHLGNSIFEFEYERSYFTANIFETRGAYENSCLLDRPAPLPDEWIVSSYGSYVEGNGSLISPVYLKSINSNSGQVIQFHRSNCSDLELQWTSVFQTSEVSIINFFQSTLGTWLPPFPYLQDPQYSYSFDPTAAVSNPIKGLKWQKLDSIRIFSNTNQLTEKYAFDYNNVPSQRLKLEYVSKVPVSLEPNEIKYTLNYNNFENLPNYFSRRTDHFGYYSGILAYVPSLPINFSTIEANYYPSRNSVESNILIGQLKEIVYPTGGKSVFEYEIHDYSEKLSNDRQSIVPASGTMGGLRIKSIKSYSDASTNFILKNYKYKKNYLGGGNQSSGILAMTPKYVWINWLIPTTFFPSGGYMVSSWSNNTLIPFGNKFEDHMGYSEVTEIRNDSSSTVYKFLTHSDIKDELPYGNLNLDYSPYAKFSDKSHMRGKIRSIAKYNSQKNLVHDVKYKYSDTTGDLNFNEYGITCDAKFGFSCAQSNYAEYYVGNATKIFHNKFLIDTIETKYYYTTGTLSSKEIFQYSRPMISTNKYAFLMQKSITNSDGKEYMEYFKHSFDHTSAYLGQQAMMTSLVNAHRFPIIYSEKKVNGSVVDGTQSLYNDFASKLLPRYLLRYEGTWNNGSFTAEWDTIQEISSYNLDFNKPTEIKKKNWSSEIISLNGRGKPYSWSFSNHNRSYSYFLNDYLHIFTDIDGQQKSYFYDGYGRVKQSILLPKNINSYFNYHLPTSITERGFFKTRTTYPLVANSAMDSVVHIAYVDGMGRPLQAIRKYGAPNGADVITKSEYDNVGRNYRDYEAIPILSNHGVYYTGAFSGGYTEQQYYADPLDRMSHHTPPAWQATQTSYGTNTAALTNPEGLVYPASSLMLTTTTDPDGLHTDVYSDKLGKSVLLRRRGGSNTTDTWTVYDDKQRPSTIYPPGSSPATPELIHRMVYDGDDNIIWQKKPDATAEEYRYSARNLQTARRNAILAAQGKWLVTHYDLHGRPTKRGYFTGAEPGTTETPTISTLLEEYFYDGYNGSTTNSAPIYKGKLKKSRIKVLEDNAVNANWVETEYNYDIYGRVSTENITNHLGGSETKTYSYDFADNITTESHVITGANGVAHVNNYTYDAQGRKIFDKVTLNSNPEVTTASYNYDHKNQIAERNLGRFTTTGTNQYLQSLDYTYNAQGWLTAINTLSSDYLSNIDPCDINKQTTTNGTTSSSPDNDIFALGIDYNATMPGSGVPARQNGSITTLKWWHANQYNQTYSYMYDHLNRVTTAKHGQIAAGAYSLLNQYNEKFQYDSRGNILKLDRQGMVQRAHIHDQCYQVATIDSLDYVYASGSNRLIQVVDKAPCPDVITLPAEIDRDITYAASQEIRINNTTVSCDVNLDLYAPNTVIIDSLKLPSPTCTAPIVTTYPGPCPQTKYTEGFQQQSSSGLYTYDTGGNMTYDPNKKLTFYYNYLNLAYKVVGQENDELQFLYSADGTLLQRKYIKDGVQISKRDYLRSKEYMNDMLESVYHNNGRALPNGGLFNYEYHIKDHLGNVRVTFEDFNSNGTITFNEIKSRNDYYSFGMEWNNKWEQIDTLSPLNLKRYNGKELFTEMNLGMLDYHARMMDPVLGRFWITDILSQKMPSWSGYSYGFNNPLRFVDPDGKAPQDKIIEISKGNFKYIKDQYGTNLISTHFLNGDIAYTRMNHGTVLIKNGSSENKLSNYVNKIKERRENIKKAGNIINNVGDGIAAAGYFAAPFTEGTSLVVAGVGEGISLGGKAITNAINIEESGATSQNLVNLGVDIVAELAPLPLENLVKKSNLDDASKKIIRAEIGKLKQVSEYVIKKEIDHEKGN
jgi:RHS repeat-associated protein